MLVATFAIDLVRAEDDAVPPVDGKVPVERPPEETRSKSDEALALAVSHELAADRRVNTMQIKVAVRQGVVTLTGSAHDDEAKQAAENGVRRVPGVKEVRNELVIPEHGAPAPGTSAIPDVPAAR